ncbi:MAG: DUF3426 domain-containing protein [Xanthomonadaceae bacterium]|nr:DUF3426 domain-containing protein [Xanthomonadaceae bacterium]
MYTRCDECQTLFRVTRAQLNAARGQVRCGRCGNVFDALLSLQEELLVDDAHEQEADIPRDEIEYIEQDEPYEPDDAPQYDEQPLFMPLDMDPPQRRRRWPWALAAFVLALALTAQAVHLQRETLVEHERFGPYVSMAYERLGIALRTEGRYDLNAFALLHHELVTHPRTSGALHLSGVLNNGAPFAQRWPVLELRLEDRFGDIIAARRLHPREYLRNPPPDDEPMPANARRAIEIEFVDPGHDAVGFSIDFCLELRDGLRCSAQTER